MKATASHRAEKQPRTTDQELPLTGQCAREPACYVRSRRSPGASKIKQTAQSKLAYFYAALMDQFCAALDSWPDLRDRSIRYAGRRTDLHCDLHQRRLCLESCFYENCDSEDGPAGTDRRGRGEADLAPSATPSYFRKTSPGIVLTRYARNGRSRDSAEAASCGYGKCFLAAGMRHWIHRPYLRPRGSLSG